MEYILEQLHYENDVLYEHTNKIICGEVGNGMSKADEAIALFEKNFNCCQAVLSVFSEELQCDKELALKIATGFGGGMRKAEVCGAVTGAVMVLGLKYGYYKEDDIETKSKAYEITREFMDKFQEKNKTVVCKELLGRDLSIKKEHDILEQQGAFTNMCPVFIRDAIEILEMLIAE